MTDREEIAAAWAPAPAGESARSGEGRQAEPPPVTYDGASSRYGPGTHAARERYDELRMRDVLARSYAKLRASGEYDPAKHGAGDAEQLTAAEHLELIATGEYLSRAYKPLSEIDHALRGGGLPGRRSPTPWTPARRTRGWPTGPGRTASTTCSRGPRGAWA